MITNFFCFFFQGKLPFKYDLERIIDDWVLLGFLVGNDFIPHLPQMHINHVRCFSFFVAYLAKFIYVRVMQKEFSSYRKYELFMKICDSLFMYQVGCQIRSRIVSYLYF